MKEFKHAFIAPVSYLSLIPEDSDFHLVLAHLMHIKEYATFYKNRSERGDYIIMDNGAFENGVPYNTVQIKEAIDRAEFMPNCIVAPDYPGKSGYLSWMACLDFIDELPTFAASTTTVMFVPQSQEGDWYDWIKCYQAGCELPDIVSHIGMSILGIPNAFKHLTGTSNITFNRTFASQVLKQSGKVGVKKHHYLGCGDPRELLMMRKMGIADSNDSSTAIWHGHLDIAFDNTASGLRDGKSPIEVDFKVPARKTTRVIEDNIYWIGNILSASIP